MQNCIIVKKNDPVLISRHARQVLCTLKYIKIDCVPCICVCTCEKIHASLDKPGGICNSGSSLNRYLQAHPGDTRKFPSKLTAYIYIYISIVPDLMFKEDVLRTNMYMSVDIYSLP